MIQLWGRANAYNVQKAIWVLEETGISYRHHDVGRAPGDLQTPEFKALNPHQRIPVIEHDGQVIWESNTIVRYLAACFGAASLGPDSAFGRSLAERWMDWELTRLQPDFIRLFWGYYRTPPAQRDVAAIEQAQQGCAADLRQLDRQLAAHNFLAGDDLTVADIACGICLYRYFNLGLEVEAPAHLLQWYQRLQRRPAYRKAVMTDFSELKGRLEY